MTIVFRKVKEEDMSRGLLETVHQLAPDHPYLTYGRAKQIAKQQKTKGIKTTVAIDTETCRVVGCCSLILEPKFNHVGGLAARIEDVAVAKDYQKRGIGKALIQHSVNEAKKSGAYKVVLNCYAAVGRFYEKLGFYENGIEMRMDMTDEK
jgi:GNAT superfamily N-acetyltransferase